MKCKQLFQKIDELNDRYLDVWEKFVSIESPTDYKVGVDAASAYLESLGRELGFSCERFPQPIAGDVVSITMNGEAEGAPVILSGHVDTVHAVGSFGTPPTHKKDGKLYGPGVSDCKGGIVAALLAMHALRDVGFSARPIKLILQTDEEQNSIPSGGRTIDILVQEAKGAIAFLNCEATRGHSAVMTRKGILRFLFTHTGRAAHASKCTDGVSAICEAAHKILELEKMKDMDGITACCGLISGGTAENAVPDSCTFTVDFRFHTSEEMLQIRERVKTIAETSYVGASCTVTQTSYRPAMDKSDKNDELLAKMNRIYSDNGMPTLIGRFSTGGSDASYTTIAAIPTVDSIGVDGDGVHTPGEFAYIHSLAEAAKRLAAVAYCIE